MSETGFVCSERLLQSIVGGVQWLTQRRVKYVRWLRHFMRADKPLRERHAGLRTLCAEL